MMKNALLRTPTLLVITTIAILLARPASTMTLYDDFSSSLLDEKRWSDLEFVREARDGKFVSMVRQEYPQDACIYAAGMPNSIESEVTLKELEGHDSSLIRCRIGQWIYNDGASSGSADYTGDVWAELGVGLYYGAQESRWYIWKSMNAEHSSWSLLGSDSLGPVSKGVLYRLSLSWDPESGTVIFSLDGTSQMFIVSDPINDPSSPAWGIGTKLSSSSSLPAMVKGVFDNVKKDGVLYDDFTGTGINISKWGQGDLVREIRDGKCNLSAHARPGEEIWLPLAFSRAEGITRIQADATVRRIVSGGASIRVLITGSFYSDGPDSDILPRICIEDKGDGSPNCSCDIFRMYRNKSLELLDTFFLGPVTPDQRYLLLVGYDGDRSFEFQLDDAMHSFQGPPRDGPPHDFASKMIMVRMEPGGAEGSIIADIDDVMITSELYVSATDDTCGGKSPCYTSIQEAINAAITGSAIRTALGTYHESLALDESKALTLEGGWDSTFTTVSAETRVNALTIREGTVIPYRLVIQDGFVKEVGILLHGP